MAIFDRTIIDLIESSNKNFKALPLNLGAVPGSGGGIGAPPGGYIGWLPQTRVAYDIAESGTLATSVSGSLLDNLNHIRYRLQQIEAGSGVLVVDEYDGSPSVSPTNRISFSGAVVTDLGGGRALVSMSGGGGLDTSAGDARYLKLDTSNDPLTDQLDIINANPGNGGIYIVTEGDSYTADFEQFNSTQNFASSPVILAYREISNSKTSNAYILNMDEVTGTGGSFIGGVFHFNSNGNDRLIYNPNITASGGVSLFFDTNTVMTSDGKIFQLLNSGAEEFYVTGGGLAYSSEGKLIVASDSVITTGWLPRSETWTRTGNHTFTVSGDFTAVFKKSAKIRYKDGGGFEYGVVSSSSFSSGTTTVNLIVNSDYAMAAATITDTYISYIECPLGWPTFFNYTVTWSRSGTAFTNPPTIDAAMFRTVGNQMIGIINFTMPASAGGTGEVYASAPATIVTDAPSFGWEYASTAGFCICAAMGSINKLNFYKSGAVPIDVTNGYKYSFEFKYLF